MMRNIYLEDSLMDPMPMSGGSNPSLGIPNMEEIRAYLKGLNPDTLSSLETPRKVWSGPVSSPEMMEDSISKNVQGLNEQATGQKPLEDTSDMLLNFTDPMQLHQLGKWGAKGIASSIPFMIGAFESRPWLRKPLTSLVERRTGPEIAQKFAQDIIDADPQDAYSVLIKALGLEGQQAKQATHGLEWEAVSDTPPHSILPYHGKNLVPYARDYTMQRPFHEGPGGVIGPFTLEDQGQIHGPKVNAMIEGGLRGTGTHPYPMELVTGPFHGEEGIDEFKTLLNELSSTHTSWTPQGVKVDQPRIVGGETAGGHVNVGHPDLKPKDIQAFLRTWVEDISPYFYPTQPSGLRKSREGNATPANVYLSNLLEREAVSGRAWGGDKWLSKEDPSFLEIASRAPGKFNELNFSKLTEDIPYLEIRSPRSPKDVGEAVENMTVAEAAMQETMRRRGTTEGRMPDTAAEYMPWLYENKIKPNADEIRNFRSQEGLDPTNDVIPRTTLNPSAYEPQTRVIGEGPRPSAEQRAAAEDFEFTPFGADDDMYEFERAARANMFPAVDQLMDNARAAGYDTSYAEVLGDRPLVLNSFTPDQYATLRGHWRNRNIEGPDDIVNIPYGEGDLSAVSTNEAREVYDWLRNGGQLPSQRYSTARRADRYSNAYTRLMNRVRGELGEPPSMQGDPWGHQGWWERLQNQRPNISRSLGSIEDILSDIAPPNYQMPW